MQPKKSITMAQLPVASDNQTYRLRFHGPTFSAQDLIINPDVIPAKVGDIVRIASPSDEGKWLLLQVTDVSKVKGNIQLSVSQYIADLFALPETVRLEVVSDPSKFYVDQGIYVGRGEMHKLRSTLEGKPLFSRQPVTLSGLRVTVNDIWSGHTRWTGIVAPHTKLVFRSKSARFFVFLQLSREMLEFDADGDLYFEKAIKLFLEELFNRWTVGDYDHALSVVLFSRSFFAAEAQAPPNAERHRDGRFYVDYYRDVVHMENRADWGTVIRDLKVAFTSFRKVIASDNGANSSASEGNFLEAINLALNVFGKHNVDRDLRRTGQQIIVVTAGNGQFDVDPQLNKLTKRRIMEGIGCDVVCLKSRPLHAVPFFRMFHSDGRVSYNIPSWFYVCYVRSEPEQQQVTPGSVGSLNVLVPYTNIAWPEDPAEPHLKPRRMTSLMTCNPFSTERPVRLKPTASKRRWTNLFHAVAEQSPAKSGGAEVAANPNYKGLLEGINWDSMTEPASLPLATDYFPTDIALKNKFTEHPYTMSLIPLENPYDDNPRLLLKELVFQRLVHGYQIVTHRSRILTAEEAADKYGLVASVVYLSMAQDFQIISYDPIVSPHNVEVKIFHNIEGKDVRSRFDYNYLLCSDASEGPAFHRMSATFSNDKMNYRLWNVLDRFVAGQVQRDTFPQLKYWRVGFILIASAAARRQVMQVDLEWRRKSIENFNSFREFLETAKLPKGQARREMDIKIPDFAITLTGAPGEVTGGRGKLDPSEISALAKRMAIDANLIRDWRKGLRTFRDAILGSECIDFILHNVNVGAPEEAVNLAGLMIQFGMLSVLKGPVEDFGNAVLKLVRVEPLRAVSTANIVQLAVSGAGIGSASGANEWNGVGPSVSMGAGAGAASSTTSSAQGVGGNDNFPSSRKMQRSETEMSLKLGTSFQGTTGLKRLQPSEGGLSSGSTSGNSGSTSAAVPVGGGAGQGGAGGGGGPSSLGSGNSLSGPSPATSFFEDDGNSSLTRPNPNTDVGGAGPTSKSLNKFSLVMESADRYEWLYVAHDQVYHPNRTFHLVLEWISCTGSSVFELVQLMHRKAKACNLEMIQIPLNFYQRSDPFFYPVEIPFNVSSLSTEECEAFQNALLCFSNFLLMQASSFEWVHVSGASFVIVAENHSFLWYFNSLLIERDKAEKGTANEAREILKTFRQTAAKFERAFKGEIVFTAEDSADVCTVLSFVNVQHREKLEALAVAAGLVSLSMLGEMIKSR